MCRNAPNLCCVFFFYPISSYFLKFMESHQIKILRIEPELALLRTLAARKLALYSSFLGEAQKRFSATVSLVEFYSFPEKRNKKNVAEVRFLRSIEGDRKTVFVEKIQSAQRARRAFSAKHKSGSLRQFFSRILFSRKRKNSPFRREAIRRSYPNRRKGNRIVIRNNLFNSLFSNSFCNSFCPKLKTVSLIQNRS